MQKDIEIGTVKIKIITKKISIRSHVSLNLLYLLIIGIKFKKI